MAGCVDMGMSICGDPYCSGCELDVDNDDDYWDDLEEEHEREDEDWYDDDLWPQIDDTKDAPLPTLEQPLTQNDEDEIPF